MEDWNDAAAHAGRRSKLRLIAGLFAGLLVVCTLFGNTLMALTLPKAAAQEAALGQLERSYAGSAVLEPSEEKELSGPAGWKVERVLVKEGDAVHKGQTLVTYANGGLSLQIDMEQAALKKMNLSLEQLEFQYAEAAKGEDESALLAAKTQLESAKVDIESQRQRIADMQRQLKEGGQLTAPFDGTVSELNAEEGRDAGVSGMPDVRLTDAAKGFRFSLQLPADIASSLEIGGEVEVRLPDEDGRTVTGKVTDLAYGSGQSDKAGGAAGEGNSGGEDFAQLEVSLSDKTLREGRKVEANFALSGEGDTFLLPSSAVRTDGSGSYVFTLEERPGPLGNAFYAVRRDVKVAGSDDVVTAISEGLFEHEQVIVECSEPIADGSRVRL